ncbi:RNA polymerase subunit sigma [Streptomyces sp. ME03-5709C]|nr:RNA polymerase subunit sigma [Streptomyces sp. ME03-5709C]
MEFSDDAVPIAELLDERRHLLDMALWMVGASTEAESVVDEAYRRWFALPAAARGAIESPGGWLVRAVGTIGLGRPAPSAGYTGPAVAAAGPAHRRGGPRRWATGEVPPGDPAALSPAERAAYGLGQRFRMALDAVAAGGDRPEPEFAGSTGRAGRTVRACRSHPATGSEHDAVVRAVRAACLRGDAARLSSLMCPDATASFDGGGKLRALVRPVYGAEPVARSLLVLLGHHQRVALCLHSVNGRTGVVARYRGQVVAVVGLDVADRRVAQAWIVLNPEKLRRWNSPARTVGPVTGS